MSELQILHPFFALISFLLGSITGLFLYVVVYRMSRGLSVVDLVMTWESKLESKMSQPGSA